MSDWDDLLDRGLRSYVAEEPPPGLEARILARARRKGAHASWWWAGWAVAACGAWMAWTVNRPVETLSIKPVWRFEAPPLMIAATPNPTGHRRPGITEAERALMRFVEEHPDDAAATAARMNDPIAIDRIEIEPLAINELEAPEETKR